MRQIDLLGKRFGKLLVVSRDGKDKKGNTKDYLKRIGTVWE